MSSDISFKTAECYKYCLEAHTFDLWKEKLVDSITLFEIRELIKLKVGNRSPSHQKNLLKYIRGAMSFGIEKGYLNNNPTPRMKF
jgi:hypothetical protein